MGSVDALGNVTQTVLDPNGNVRMVVDSDGNETHYVYNRDGQVTETMTPLGTTTMAYDAAGRLTQTTDADGRTIQYSYDAADRLTGEVWKNASSVTVNVVTYSYDNDGNLLTGADYNGTVTFTYDALDRVQSYTNVFGLTLTYSYDANDNLTQRTDSLGGTLTYVYDNANRLTSEKFTGTGATGTTVRVDFGYDAANEQTSITWYSNLAGTATVAASAYSYDNAGRLTSIVNTNASSATLSYYTYTYDNADRVSAQTHWSQVGTTTYSGTNTYTYDAISQLLSDGTATYSYDANGNRTMAGYSTGSDNEMSSDGTYTYTYDAVGNLTQKTTGSGASLVTCTYSYDNANELTGIVETGSSGTILQITYTYDVLGKRVQEQVWQSGVATTTRYAYDGDTLWAQLDGSTNLEDRYLYQPNDSQILVRIVASGGNAGAWGYFTDAQGSVRDLVNWSGQLGDHIEYTGYGVPTESNSSVGSIIGYDGYQYEVSTALDYTWARWYNPSTGTWLTQDPIGFGGGQANLYQYVANDPTNAIDPSGEDRILSLPDGSFIKVPDVSLLLGGAEPTGAPGLATLIGQITGAITQLEQFIAEGGRRISQYNNDTLQLEDKIGKEKRYIQAQLDKIGKPGQANSDEYYRRRINIAKTNIQEYQKKIDLYKKCSEQLNAEISKAKKSLAALTEKLNKLQTMQNAGGTKLHPGSGNPRLATVPSTAQRDAADLMYILQLQQTLNKMAQALRQQFTPPPAPPPPPAILKNNTKKQ